MNALELGSTSLQLTQDMDREGWLALFADDAVVEDPVGGVPGGHQGVAAIRAFHDSTISLMKGFEYRIERAYLCGEECAMVVSFQIDLGETRMDMDVVNIYRATPDGKLASLRSFWDGSKQG